MPRVSYIPVGNNRAGRQRSPARLLRAALPRPSLGECRSGCGDYHSERDRRRSGQEGLLRSTRSRQRLVIAQIQSRFDPGRCHFGRETRPVSFLLLCLSYSF